MAEETGVRARILNTALRLFVAQGYNGVSMREIAALCQLSKAGLYYHFEDKEDLFLEIINNQPESTEYHPPSSRWAASWGTPEDCVFRARLVHRLARRSA